MITPKAMTVKDNGEELQTRAIKLDREGWIQITQDRLRALGCILGQEQREASPGVSRSAELGPRLTGQPLQVSATDTLQPKASPVTVGRETWLQPYRQELK